MKCSQITICKPSRYRSYFSTRLTIFIVWDCNLLSLVPLTSFSCSLPQCPKGAQCSKDGREEVGSWPHTVWALGHRVEVVCSKVQAAPHKGCSSNRDREFREAENSNNATCFPLQHWDTGGRLESWERMAWVLSSRPFWVAEELMDSCRRLPRVRAPAHAKFRQNSGLSSLLYLSGGADRIWHIMNIWERHYSAKLSCGIS